MTGYFKRRAKIRCEDCDGFGGFDIQLGDDDDCEWQECETCDGTGRVDNPDEPDPDAEDMTPYKDNLLGD